MPKPQKTRDVLKVVRQNGWVFLRDAKGSHELWGLPDESVKEIIPAGHKEVSAGIIKNLIEKLDESPQSWV